MNFQAEFKPKAIKDLKNLPVIERRRIVAKIAAMQTDLAGEVKKLTDFTPEYKLRVGHYRNLFEVDQDKIVIYRVLHRKDAYQ